MTLHYNIIMVLDTYRAQHKIYDVTAWGAIQTATVAMHADGNGTGSSLRYRVLKYITTSVNILWGFQYSVMCVLGTNWRVCYC